MMILRFLETLCLVFIGFFDELLMGAEVAFSLPLCSSNSKTLVGLRKSAVISDSVFFGGFVGVDAGAG